MKIINYRNEENGKVTEWCFEISFRVLGLLVAIGLIIWWVLK